MHVLSDVCRGYHRAVPTKTPHPPTFGRVEWTALATLGVLSILVGVWPVFGTLTTWMPVLAVPAAAGLPHLIPPLRVAPLGETTWAFWAADTAAAIIMLLAAWLWLRAAASRRPSPGRGRAFGRGVWTTTIAVVLGNVVRTVFLSFVTHSDFGTYVGYVGFGILVSALTGALFGLVVGAAAAVAAAPRRSEPAPA